MPSSASSSNIVSVGKGAEKLFGATLFRQRFSAFNCPSLRVPLSLMVTFLEEFEEEGAGLQVVRYSLRRVTSVA